ncbi:MAG: glutamate--cysteine ligase [Rhodospirillaceae bacterium]
MTSFPSKESAPITSKADLVAYAEAGNKPIDQWRVGTEHEKFMYCLESYKALTYDGDRGVRAFLEGLQRFGWEPVFEGDNVIALSAPGKGSVSLEPGGQLELSGAPLETVHQTCGEVTEHRKQVKEVAEDLGIGLLGLGMTPNWRREDVHWMPKGRYKIMRDYMPKVGKLGLDMMLRTCTVQVNLDYSSEADMVKKMRVSLALQPLATALWANSPFTEGKPNGKLSQRAAIWHDTDKDRTGMMPFAFEDGMGFERYVDFVLDAPMYFVYRKGYVDAAGQSFRDFMNGTLPALPGEAPTIADWEDHLSTVFPEVRLKKFLEMRGSDSGPWARLCALPAFWMGLLYDDQALDAAWDLVKGWSDEDRESLNRIVPTTGLKSEIAGRSLQAIALQVLDIARAGLSRRARLDSAGDDETGFLNPLQEIAASGITPAEKMLEAFHTKWNGDITKVFSEYSY